MSSDRRDEVVAFDRLVAEYLSELEQRLSGLPVLQRRELLGDLEAHIVNERAERGVTSEVELLAVLERLGTPEVVAAAAYEEAGLPEPTVQLTPVGAAPRTGGGPAPAAATGRFTGWAERTAAVDSAEVTSLVPTTRYTTGRATVAAVSRASGAPTSSPAAGGSAPTSSPAAGGSAPVSSPAAGGSAPTSSPTAERSAPPAWAPPAPSPEPYAPPSPAPVVPPPDDLLRARLGPFPPSGPSGISSVSAPAGGQGFGSGPGAGRRSDGGAPPFVGGPPFPPPPRRTAPATSPWVRAALGGAIGLVVLFVLGCLGAGAFLVRSSEPADAPAAVVEQAPPVEPIEPIEPIELIE